MVACACAATHTCWCVHGSCGARFCQLVFCRWWRQRHIVSLRGCRAGGSTRKLTCCPQEQASRYKLTTFFVLCRLCRCANTRLLHAAQQAPRCTDVLGMHCKQAGPLLVACCLWRSGLRLVAGWHCFGPQQGRQVSLGVHCQAGLSTTCHWRHQGHSAVPYRPHKFQHVVKLCACCAFAQMARERRAFKRAAVSSWLREGFWMLDCWLAGGLVWVYVCLRTSCVSVLYMGRRRDMRASWVVGGRSVKRKYACDWLCGDCAAKNQLQRFKPCAKMGA